MVFAETPVFTRQVLEKWTDDELAQFQQYLADNPTAGDVIPDTGGVRKVRWKLNAKGKRGGSRVIYFWAQNRDQILLLLIYGKNDQEDLTSQQKAMVRAICGSWNEKENQ